MFKILFKYICFDLLKRIIISVNNDVVNDQRVLRTAGTLSREGYEIQIVGRWLKNTISNPDDIFKVHRFRMIFHSGPLSYACFNVRLFFFLLLRKSVLYFSNDLDTLPANYLVSRIKQIPLLYDSHEYFTEVPELIGREKTRRIWLKIERAILPRLKYSCTVNHSIAKIYEEKYSISMGVVRNLPELNNSEIAAENIPGSDGKQIIIYQGVLNMGRGLDHLIESMQFVTNALCLIVGDGPEYSRLSGLIRTYKVEEKVKLIGKMSPLELKGITLQADLGVSIEENMGLNYYYGLPNKIFDYIHAGVPVLASPFPEMKNLLDEYGVGETLISREPSQIGKQINSILGNTTMNNKWKKNLEIARKELCWQNEEVKLIDLLSKIEQTHRKKFLHNQSSI